MAAIDSLQTKMLASKKRAKIPAPSPTTVGEGWGEGKDNIASAPIQHE
jgi:hypothetical protein